MNESNLLYHYLDDSFSLYMDFFKHNTVFLSRNYEIFWLLYVNILLKFFIQEFYIDIYLFKPQIILCYYSK